MLSLEWSQQGDQRAIWREELEITEGQIRDIRAQILAQYRYTGVRSGISWLRYWHSTGTQWG